MPSYQARNMRTKANFPPSATSYAVVRRLCAVLILFIAASALAADAPPVNMTIRRAAGPITIDGDLSDPGWQNALKSETWYETNPGDNTEPKVKTVGYVAYDEHFFYA